MSCLARLLATAILLSTPLASLAQPDDMPVDTTTTQATQRTLRKCVSRSGAVSIQNGVCAAGSKTAWVRATVPEQLDEARRHELVEQALQRDADSRYLSRLAGTDGRSYRSRRPVRSSRSGRSSRNDKAGACEAARQYRKTILKAIGLKRDIDLLRSLNDRVHDACR